MPNYSRRGTRVKIKPGVVTFYRRFRGDEQGTIVCELENGVGRKLIECAWAGIGQSPVFEEDIIILSDEGEKPPG